MEGEKVKRRREGKEQGRKEAVGEKGKGDGRSSTGGNGREEGGGGGKVGVKTYGRREETVEKGSGWRGGNG